jgi:hypothetical protein
MTLQEFISRYDHAYSIVLLEGKRKVNKDDESKLFSLGKLLATQSNTMIFRSGNAEGADQFFSEGVASVDNKRLQLITPYSGHRKKQNPSYYSVSLDEIIIAEEKEVIYQSKSNKSMSKLIDQFVAGDKNRNSVKAAYILRDTIKAIGAEGIQPATFGIFYDDLSKPQSGGTGHTMKICLQNNIPIIDQKIWFGWLDEQKAIK